MPPCNKSRPHPLHAHLLPSTRCLQPGVSWLLNCIPFSSPSPEVIEASACSPACCREETVLQDLVMIGELWDVGLFWPGLCPRRPTDPQLGGLGRGRTYGHSRGPVLRPRLLDESGNSDSHSRGGDPRRGAAEERACLPTSPAEAQQLAGLEGFCLWTV